MAFNHNGAFGKDRVPKGSEAYIEEALSGGKGPSEGIHDKRIKRPQQSIMTPVALDNVKQAMDIESSILDEGGFGGGIDNLKHSLTGASAENDEVGAAEKVKSTVIPNH